jgi:magnesium transporter
LHAILDQVVDGYFPIVEQLEERIEKLEDEVLEAADRRVLQHIVELKKTVLMFRNFILPQRKIIGQLGRPSTPIYIRRSTMAYFRDVYDHVVRISDTLDTYRDALNSTMDAYMSTVSQRMNEIMKTLTIITTMMMPLTVITSFYGMNIHLPEVKWGIKGYWFVLGLLALAMGSMWFFIKRRKWI